MMNHKICVNSILIRPKIANEILITFGLFFFTVNYFLRI
jgi:hypothetical protein